MKRLVYLDASSIRQANFALTSAPFRLLQSLAAHGLIEVITSDITLSELLEQSERVINSLRKASAEAQLFSNLGAMTVLGQSAVPDTSKAGPQLVSLLRKFFESAGFTSIGAMSRPSGPIFERYFQRRPPFGSGKKKSEFPDAFVLDALLDLAKERNAVVDVVSNDNDWASSAAEHSDLLHHHSFLSQLMQELQQLPGADLAQAEANFQHEKANLEHAIADIIVNQSVSLGDSVGDVLSVDVKAVEVEEPRVTTIDDNGVAGYECYATATLELEVYVPRESSYVYDSEEKTGAYLDWSYAEIEREVEFTVDFSLELAKPRKVEFEHTSVTLNYGRPIQVYLDTDAADNYK